MEKDNYAEEGWIKKSGETFQKQKVDCLWINFEFYDYLQDADPRYVIRDVAEGLIMKNEVISEAEQILETVANLAATDMSNMKKCISFINEKFPHAFILLSDYCMEISNLATEEMAECLYQKDLMFNFYEKV